MKKLLFFFSLLFCAVGMSAASGFVLKGKTSQQFDGKKIYLSSSPSLDPTARVDSVIIKNGMFTMKGISAPEKAYFLLINSRGSNATPRAQVVIPEDGVINVTLGEKSKIGGTLTNDAYAGFDDQRALIEKGYSLLQSLYYKLKNGNKLTQAKEDSIDMEWNKLSLKEHELVLANLSRYSHTGFGAYLIYRYQTDMEVSVVDSLVSSLPAKVKDQAIIKSVEKELAAKKRAMIGATYTDMEMTSIDGKIMKLSDYVGKCKYLMVDFWASWCGPCRQEMPNVVEAYKQFHDKGFEVVGVSFDQNKSAWSGAVAQLKMPWPQMSDLKGWDCAAHSVYGINAIPASILIDGNGKIVAANLRGEALTKKLGELLK